MDRLFFWRVRAAACVTVGLAVGMAGSCAGPQKKGGVASIVPAAAVAGGRVIMDFETPAVEGAWLAEGAVAAVTTEPQSQPATRADVPYGRSSVRPNTGLWSEKLVAARGTFSVNVGTVDIGGADLVTAGVMHLGNGARNGQWLASIVVIDAAGKRVEGEAFPVMSRWEVAALDVHAAFDEGLDVSRVVSMGIHLRAAAGGTGGADSGGGELLEVQTDTWAAVKRGKVYLNADGAKSKGAFYMRALGSRLRVGAAGVYEVTLSDRGAGGGPWLEVTRGTGAEKILGGPNTGLMLLDQESFDALGDAVKRTADDASGEAVRRVAAGRVVPWPLPHAAGGELSAVRGHWEVVWTSPLGAIVEYKQEVGPYDRLGEPAAVLTWRLMIYQWGQVFVHVEWSRGEGTPPITWALLMEEKAAGDAAADGAEVLLSEIYPQVLRQPAGRTLPHRMQTGAPIAMIAKGEIAGSPWWWARAEMEEGVRTKLFGVGLGPGAAGAGKGRADCMLVLNGATGLVKAGTFGQYLAPPKIVTRQGEVDRTFPGDADNDGFVESYGFQAIRLANGRANFTIYPQGRPIFYPAYLFTVPAVEREGLDVAHSRVLINIDGKQFADPPQFPDGSFLLQLPYVLDKPVMVEALLIKR